ncbi:MAG: hypothetical protein OCD76_12155 [Reichenbachiella sp.]
MRTIFRFVLLWFLAGSFFCYPVNAAVFNAASCEQNDVQSAINSAVDGDSVLVPEGECTWSHSTTNPTHNYFFDNAIPPVIIWEKGISLIGAGMTKTIITANEENPPILIYARGKDGRPYRISGFTFNKNDNEHISVTGTVDGWRIDNCAFNASLFYRAIKVYDDSYGVIDNNMFKNTRVLVFDGDGHESWKRPLSLGSADAVYVEDNYFEFDLFGNVMDCNAGARYVFRYNTVVNSYIEAHSLQNSSPDGTFQRASRSYEIYKNTIRSVDNGASHSNWTAMSLRGGTGVVFENTVEHLSGDEYGVFCTIDNVRSVKDEGYALTICDGTTPIDGNEDKSGYPCLDQIGRSTDAGAGTSRVPQEREPLYAWNNILNGDTAYLKVHNGPLVEAHIVEGRDYFDGIEKPGYIPYIYPHPLRAGLDFNGVTPSDSLPETDVPNGDLSNGEHPDTEISHVLLPHVQEFHIELLGSVFSLPAPIREVSVFTLQGNMVKTFTTFNGSVIGIETPHSSRLLPCGVYLFFFTGDGVHYSRPGALVR